MLLLNKKNISSLITATILSGIFLWTVLTPPSLFNFLPYQIHQAMKSDAISEQLFIELFDIFSAIIIFTLSYILARNYFTTFGYFSVKTQDKDL